MNDKGYVIYHGKLSHADCFRIDNIGKIYGDDIDLLLVAIKEVLQELEVLENIQKIAVS